LFNHQTTKVLLKGNELIIYVHDISKISEWKNYIITINKLNEEYQKESDLLLTQLDNQREETERKIISSMKESSEPVDDNFVETKKSLEEKIQQVYQLSNQDELN
jgi:5S rRNA maturation endonuclease (ribonuclease M5)